MFVLLIIVYSYLFHFCCVVVCSFSFISSKILSYNKFSFSVFHFYYRVLLYFILLFYFSIFLFALYIIPISYFHYQISILQTNNNYFHLQLLLKHSIVLKLFYINTCINLFCGSCHICYVFSILYSPHTCIFSKVK